MRSSHSLFRNLWNSSENKTQRPGAQAFQPTWSLFPGVSIFVWPVLHGWPRELVIWALHRLPSLQNTLRLALLSILLPYFSWSSQSTRQAVTCQLINIAVPGGLYSCWLACTLLICTKITFPVNFRSSLVPPSTCLQKRHLTNTHILSEQEDRGIQSWKPAWVQGQAGLYNKTWATNQNTDKIWWHIPEPITLGKQRQRNLGFSVILCGIANLGYRRLCHKGGGGWRVTATSKEIVNNLLHDSVA